MWSISKRTKLRKGTANTDLECYKTRWRKIQTLLGLRERVSPSLKTETINPIQTGLSFCSSAFWDREGREGLIRPPPLNSKNIEAMTTKRGREIVRPKMFPTGLAKRADDVM